jgi:hypothetical protein
MMRDSRKQTNPLKSGLYFPRVKAAARAGAQGLSCRFRPTGQILHRESTGGVLFHIGQTHEKPNDSNSYLQLQNFYNEVLDTRRPRLI